MAIALPPPIDPQEASPVELRQQWLAQPAVSLDFQGARLHVFGEHLVAEERLRLALAAATNLSEAIRAIGYAQYVAGYPASLASYAAVQEGGGYDIYVRVVPGRVREVGGPPALLPYFADLNGAKAPLTSAALESDRALADGYTERAGEQYKPQFVRLGGDEVRLDLGQPAPGARQTAVLGSFSNYGNRYAGPYLAQAGLRQDFSSGDELSASGAASVRFLGLGGERSEPYHEGDAGWSRVTRFGVFALQGRYADFSQQVQAYRFDGTLESASAAWLYPLHSDFRQRLNLQARLLREHEAAQTPAQTVDCNALGGLLGLLGLVNCPMVASPGGEVLSELYNSAELGLSYVGHSQHGEQQAELQAGLVLRKGLGPHRRSGSNASLDYFLVQPSFGLRVPFTARWTALADGSFQFSNSALPQQEKFVLGGPASQHAYEAGAGLGDHGESLRLGLEWKGTPDSWSERCGIRPRGFVEYGSSRLEAGALGAGDGRVTVADVGAATDLRFTSWLGGSLSLAQSIYSRGAENSPDGLATKYVFFQLAAKY
jgi:hemolysin activation/secretion protein